MLNFLIGLPMMLLCLIVQVTVAFWCVRHYVRAFGRIASGRGVLSGIRPLLVAMLAMMVGNLVQIMLWGRLFLWLGEFERVLRRGLPLGGELHLARLRRHRHEQAWKLLGPLEAVNGVLMLGMSAAALMAILQHMIKKLNEKRPTDGLT